MADIFDFYVYDDRSIQFELAEPIMLEDKDVTQFRFRIPKSLNGFNMTRWAWWFVYENADKETYSSALTLVDDLDEPDTYANAIYTVDYGLSIKAGAVRFALEAINADNSGNVLHEWHTKTYATYIQSTLQGNQAEYSESETDIISALINRVQEFIDGGDTALQNRVTALEGKTDADTTYSFTADKATASDGTEQEVTVTKVNGHTVEADVPTNAKFTDTVPHIELSGVYEDDTDAVSGHAVYRFIINGNGGHDANSVKRTDMDSALSEFGVSTPVDYSNAKMLMANAGQFYKDDQNCVNVLAMAEIINALCQQIDSNTNGISAKQDALTFDSEPTADSTNPVTSGGIKAYVDKSPLADKKILIIGDSISTDAYGSYKKWVTDLVDDGVFTKSNVTNNSYHATGFVRTYDENSNVVYDNFPNRLKAITDTSYDMVITFGGINDYIGGTEWDAFKTAVDAYFSDLTSRFIDSRLVVISPLRTYNIYKNAAGHYQQEYANYIIKVARSYALPVLDLTHGSGYYPFVDTFKAKWTLVPSGYTGGDGVHPNLEYGKKYLAPLIQNFLENPLSGTYTEPASNVDMSAYYTKAEVDAAIAKAIKEATGTKEFAFDGASRTPKTLVWGDSLSPQYYYTNFNANTGGLGNNITDAKITDTEVTFSSKTYYGGPMFVFKCTAGKTYTLSVDVPYGMLSWGELTTTTTTSDTTLPIKAENPTVLINNWGDSGGHKTFEMKPTTDYFFIAFGKSDKAPITWDNITLTES